MHKLLAISILIYLIVPGIRAQQTIEIKNTADFIEIDNQENLYVISGSEIKRYTKYGLYDYSYSNKINGAISAVDVSNPQKILVFYNESSTLVFLNQQLSPISDNIDIYETFGVDATMAGTSTNGGFWVFAFDRQSLILYNATRAKMHESMNISELTEGEDVSFIREQNQKLYIGVGKRVLVFDIFGSYITTLHFACENLKILPGQICYTANNKLWVYNLPLKTEEQKVIPEALQTNRVFYYKKYFYGILPNKIMLSL